MRPLLRCCAGWQPASASNTAASGPAHGHRQGLAGVNAGEPKPGKPLQAAGIDDNGLREAAVREAAIAGVLIPDAPMPDAVIPGGAATAAALHSQTVRGNGIRGAGPCPARGPGCGVLRIRRAGEPCRPIPSAGDLSNGRTTAGGRTSEGSQLSP